MGDSFDKSVLFHEKDCFEVVVTNPIKSIEHFIYMFEFKNKKWVALEKGAFELENKSDEIINGYFKYK